ncbi:unnamed protein product [Choristocarpus tenellus]
MSTTDVKHSILETQWVQLTSLYRSLRERDQEINFLRHRVRLLLNINTIVDSTQSQDSAPGELLETRLTDAGFPVRQVENIMNRMSPPSHGSWSPAMESAKALECLLSPTPKAGSTNLGASHTVPGLSTVASSVDSALDGDEVTSISYSDFLDRLALPESGGMLKATQRFVLSVVGPDWDGFPPQLGQPGPWPTLEFHGTAYLKESTQPQLWFQFCTMTSPNARFADFISALQDAMSIHPSWAWLGYEGVLTCRGHLERYVMTKIHHLALAEQLDRAADANVARRLNSLQFLTPDDLDVGLQARDDFVLTMAQEELKKMVNGRCPEDIMTCLVRCCDIILGMLDHVRRAPGSSKPERLARSYSQDSSQSIGPVAAADEFLPVFIYVVLKSNVKRLPSICNYLQAYFSPTALMSRPGYCFVNLRSAVEFLMNVDGSTLSMAQEEFERRRALAEVLYDGVRLAPGRC